MKLNELRNRIIELLENINEEEYPQIVRTLKCYVDVAEECAYNLFSDLFDSDQTKVLPYNVSDFMIELASLLIDEECYDAACTLGALYYKGRFGKVDYIKAVHYYKLAADNGVRQAQENLGYCYYCGRDVEIDYEKAFHYFSLGAFDGHINSLYKIGDMYRNGYYVEKNPVEAYRIYRRCLDTLTDEAVPYVGADVMFRMGDCYFEGIGTEVDLNEAYAFYHNAEILYYQRLLEGDFLIKGCYKKVVDRQEEIRNKRNSEIPGYEWVK